MSNKLETFQSEIHGSGKLIDYLKESNTKINSLWKKNGVILLRGFETKDLHEFQNVAEIVCEELLDYTYRSSPRTKLAANIYTSTEYPKNREIPQHNENSYALRWPKKIIFHCVIAPETQGETPIASSAKVYELIDPEIRREFEQKKVMYVRNYRAGIDLGWREVFQTNSKYDVEQYCRLNQIDCEWIDGDSLRTRQISQATLIHSDTKQCLWFNQAHLFHESANEPDIRDYFSANFKPDELPRNAFFGDGSIISDEKISHIRDIYKKSETMFSWKKGDTLLLDNLRYSHGRRAFTGTRKIVVALGN